jgi:hypothetical protein
MNKLKNLVPDLEEMFHAGRQPSDEDLEIFARDVLSVIKDSFKPRNLTSKEALRFSSIGRPDRQLWYTYNKPEIAEELHMSTRIKFMYGDIIEQLLVLLIKTAGYEVTDRQAEVTTDGIKGHTDGRIDGVLVDYKSASPFSFNKFVTGQIFNDDPFGYIAQLSGYADGEDEAAWVVANKVSGHIHVLTLDSMEMINFKDRVKEVKSFVEEDAPPDKCYSDKPDGESGNRKLAIGCMYCDYKVDCWKDANDGKGLRKFDYKNGPRFFTKVVKEPNKNIQEVKL